LPEVTSFLANDPDALGGGLHAMHRILRDFPGSDYRDLSWLARYLNKYSLRPSLTPAIHGGFDILAALILRKRIEIADGPMAELIHERVIERRRANDPYRSIPFLNQALKIAASDDGGETRAALAWLLDYQPIAEKMPIPTDWKHPVREVLGGSAPAKVLIPPTLDLNLLKYDHWFGPRETPRSTS